MKNLLENLSEKQQAIKNVADKIWQEGVGGIPLKSKKVNFSIYNGGPNWTFDHLNRTRLDHYGGEEGWDDEGWEADYAGPLRKKIQQWLDNHFGSGLFDVEIGEKGHVDISLTDAGLKKYGLK
jgi:hypothetical protein